MQHWCYLSMGKLIKMLGGRLYPNLRLWTGRGRPPRLKQEANITHPHPLLGGELEGWVRFYQILPELYKYCTADSYRFFYKIIILAKYGIGGVVVHERQNNTCKIRICLM